MVQVNAITAKILYSGACLIHKHVYANIRKDQWFCHMRCHASHVHMESSHKRDMHLTTTCLPLTFARCSLNKLQNSMRMCFFFCLPRTPRMFQGFKFAFALTSSWIRPPLAKTFCDSHLTMRPKPAISFCKMQQPVCSIGHQDPAHHNQKLPKPYTHGSSSITHVPPLIRRKRHGRILLR